MKIISVVFHPLMIATHLSALLLLTAPELLPRIQPQVITQFLLVVFLMTALMPAFSVFLLRSFKYISDLELENRKERIIPFTFILFYYVVASYLFHEKLDMGALFTTVIISVTLLISLLLIITSKFKISIHAAAIWGAVGYLTGIVLLFDVQLGWMYYASILIAGLTCTSRLYLGYHSSKEVWTGSIMGFSYSFFVMFFFF